MYARQTFHPDTLPAISCSFISVASIPRKASGWSYRYQFLVIPMATTGPPKIRLLSSHIINFKNELWVNFEVKFCKSSCFGEAHKKLVHTVPSWPVTSYFISFISHAFPAECQRDNFTFGLLLGSIKWQDVSSRRTGASINKFMMIHLACPLPLYLVHYCSSKHQLSRQAGVNEMHACNFRCIINSACNAGFLALVTLTCSHSKVFDV